MEWKIWIIPVIGFVIGYFTNYLAVKMLFYPRRSFLGFQGILPKRKREIAHRVSVASLDVMPDAVLKIGKIPHIGPLALEFFRMSVEKKVGSLSLDELEKIILSAIKKELRFITWVGGVLGFLIGLIEVGIFYLI